MSIRAIKILGLGILFLFASVSMLLFQFERDIQESGFSYQTKKLLTYPSYFENLFLDHRISVTIKKDYRDDRIILAAIDEVSLKEFGRFPWSRKTWVPILKKLKNYGAKIVAFDVVFSEPERFLEGVSPDDMFKNAIIDFQEDQNRVLIPFSLSSKKSNDDDISFKEVPFELFNNMLEVNQQGELGLNPYRVMSTTFPLSKILEAEPALAYIGIKEDPDGIYRKYPLVANVDDMYFNSFALSIYENYTGDKPKLYIDQFGESYLQIEKGKVYLNHNGETRIHWAGRTNVFPRISLKTVMDKEPDDSKLQKLFKDKVVFIGSTAFAAHDHRHSPIDAQMPGVYFHMNVLNMLIDGKLYKPFNDALIWSWIILLVGFSLLILVSLLKNAVADAIFIFSFSGIVFLLDIFFFLKNGYEIAMFFALFPVIFAYVWETAVNFYMANRDRNFLKAAFGNYISPELIDMMYESGKLPELGGNSAVLTAYFTDIQTFSTFSEKLTPKELVELLNEYLTVMTDVLLENQGTLDKYEGDAIIAFFGSPLYFEDHAAKACNVCISMQEELGKLREKWISEGDKWPDIVHNMRMRIGINTGEIVTGNMGSRDRMNYTMMGDAVNLAARLEEAAKQYGVYSHISEFTKKEVEGLFETRELDTIRVVGKSEPVTTYELLGHTGKTDQKIINLRDKFEEALSLYKNKKWDDALKIFYQIEPLEEECWPGIWRKTNPSKIYIERCLAFKDNPPEENWDGVYTLTAK